MNALFRSLLLALILSGGVRATDPSWTSREGVTTRAAFVRLDSEKKIVTLRFANGSSIEAPLDQLDIASRAQAIELGLAAERLEQEVTSKLRPKRHLLEEDFESRRWWRSWNLDDEPRNCELVAEDHENGMAAAHSGRRALRIRINKGSHNGTSISYYFGRESRNEPESVYFRYYLLIGNDWRYHGKMPGFAGTYGKGGWGGKPADGKNGWSARGSGASRGERFRMTTYCYHADMTGDYGDNWYWDHPGLEKGRWYCVEQFCQLNTPGEKDGILRAWIDGEQVFEKTAVRMRNVDKLKIERIWFNFYFGGKATAPRTSHAYIDDVVISESPIGPLK